MLVPRGAGTISAAGLLHADVGHEFGRTLTPAPLSAGVLDRVAALYDELEATARETLRAEGIGADTCRFERRLATRYADQLHSVDVAVPDDALDAGVLERRHHERHEALYSFRDESTPVEAVTVGLTATAERTSTSAPATDDGVPPSEALVEHRRAYDAAAEAFVRTPIYDGDRPLSGRFEGPAVVASGYTSLVVPSDVAVTVDERGNYHLNPDAE